MADATRIVARRLLRPANFSQGLPLGRVRRPEERRCIRRRQSSGRVFMGSCDDPFRYADRLLEQIQSKIVFVDFHAEAVPKKLPSMVPRRARHSRRGHAYAYPTAMRPSCQRHCLHHRRRYDRALRQRHWSEEELVIERFLSGMPARFEAANGDVRLCGVLVECDDQTGRASRVNG